MDYGLVVRSTSLFTPRLSSALSYVVYITHRLNISCQGAEASKLKVKTGFFENKELHGD